MKAILTWALAACLPALASAAGTISSTERRAWSETVGWLDLAPSQGGVRVYDDHLEGFAWAENIGWLQLGLHGDGGYHRYANSGPTDWGVNLDGATLSGYGWSETTGWLRFDPAGGGVSLDPATGVFEGWAWSENLGWWHFKGGSPAYRVVFTPSPEVSKVLVSDQDAQQLHAVVAGAGVYRSSDGGRSWRAVEAPPGDRRLKDALRYPGRENTLYAASHGSGVFKSLDGGSHWSACANTGLNPKVYALAIDSGGTLYAATRGGVFASSDCASWISRSQGLPATAGAYAQTVLAIDPLNPATLYAAVSGAGIYRSANAGASWSAASTQPADTRLRALQIKPGEPGTLFVASQGGGAFKSVDGGLNWAVCAAQPGDLKLRSLAMDSHGKLYAGTESGVYVSSNDCASWTGQNAGLP